MNQYKMWSARVAFVTLTIGLLGVGAVVPIHAEGPPNTGTIWPIPEHYGHGHVVADIEMLVTLVLAVCVVVVGTGLVAHYLLEQAGWTSSSRRSERN